MTAHVEESPQRPGVIHEQQWLAADLGREKITGFGQLPRVACQLPGAADDLCELARVFAGVGVERRLGCAGMSDIGVVAARHDAPSKIGARILA
jgi:hypothetical protein